MSLLSGVKKVGFLSVMGTVAVFLGLRASGENSGPDIVQPSRERPSVEIDSNLQATQPALQTNIETTAVPTRDFIPQGASTDPFVQREWTPAPVPLINRPAPALASAVPPSAPPLPYKFIGEIEDKLAQPAAFITRGDTLFVVRAGDVLENNYRVESFSATQVVVTYLPLKQQQTIVVSGG